MRTLTIKRAKKYVACLNKSKIYIEDPVSGDTNISGVSCRKIGDLKNGAEKSFPIGYEAAKVFVISDKLSKNYSNDFYQLPAGEENIYLTGQNRYNPANGHAFIFDNNVSTEAVSNRRKNNKKGIVVLIIAMIIGLIAGVVSSFLPASDGIFTAEELSITLTDEFFDLYEEGYNGVFANEDVVVLVVKDAFEDYPELKEYSLKQYGELIAENYSLTDSALKRENDLTYFTYLFQNPDTDETYSYKSYIFKTDNAFWIVQFATLEQDVEAYSEQIKQWATTITFEQTQQ